MTPTTTETDTKAPTTTETDTNAPTTTETDSNAPTTTETNTNAPTTTETDTNAPGTTETDTNAPTTRMTDTNAPTTTGMSSRNTNQKTAIKDSSNTTVIVAASVGTCLAVIVFVLFFLIRKRHVLKNCNLQHKQSEERQSTSFSNNMYPDIEGTSDDNKYAEIPLDNLDSIKNEDNVYQTIDALEEQETEIDDKYSHISGNALPLTNTSYSHIAGDFQNKRVVPDYTHITMLEETPKGDLKLKTNESDTSYDIIGKTKFEVTEIPNVMEPTYNHTHNDTNQSGIPTSDVDNYSHLHGLNETTHYNETMTDNRFNKHNEPAIFNPNLLHKKTGFCLKEGDAEPNSVAKTEEKEPAAFVKLSEESKVSLTEIDGENAAYHPYFVLENLDKTEKKEPHTVVKMPEAGTISLTENEDENAIDHQYFVLEKVGK